MTVLLDLRFRGGREMVGLMVKLMEGEVDAGMAGLDSSLSRTVDSRLSRSGESLYCRKSEGADRVGAQD